MIADAAKSLGVLLTRLEAAQQSETRAHDLDKRRQALSEAAERLTDAATRFGMMQTRVRTALPRAREARALAERLNKARQQLAESPEQLSKASALKPVLESTESLAKQAEAAAKEAWERHLAIARPKPDRNLLESNRSVPGFDKIVGDINLLLEEVARPAMPASPEQFELLEARFDRLRALIGKLHDFDNPEVQRFMQAAGTRDGAPLALLTPAVREWLESKALDQKYCIRPN